MKLIKIPLMASTMLMFCSVHIYGYRAYVGLDNVIAVVNSNTNKIIDSVIVPFGVNQMAITSDGRRVYFIDNNAVLRVLDTTTNSLLSISVTITGSITSLALTPDNRYAYITRRMPADVVVVDLLTNKIVEIIDLGANEAQEISITHDGSRAYVTISNPDGVVPITIATNSPGATIPVGTTPAGVVINSIDTLAFVANVNSSSITPIDITTNTPQAPIAIVPFPRIEALTPDDRILYAGSLGSFIFIVDTQTRTVKGSITSGFPKDFAITPDGNRLYVTNGVEVIVIDTATNLQIAAIQTGFNNQIVIAPAPLPPSNARASLATNKFLNKTECLLTLTWQASSSAFIQSYRLYNNNQLFATVPFYQLAVTTCINNSVNLSSLSITAVDIDGIESAPAPVNFS